MKRKYVLKPGRHQFAPGSPPVHTNDDLTDDEAEWYLSKYPHIASLFVQDHAEDESEKSKPCTAAGSKKKQTNRSFLIGEIKNQ